MTTGNTCVDPTSAPADGMNGDRLPGRAEHQATGFPGPAEHHGCQ
ncbi:hypothetical protein ACWGLF_20405 [Streptomyces puniciscabiei]